jgi:glycosyltransferase involved in cell wall biosynthesis
MKFILYDNLQVAGGAERVTLACARGFPDAQIVVSRVYPEVMPLLAAEAPPIRQLGDGSTRMLSRIPESIYCFKHRCSFLRDAEAVYYSGFYAPLAVRAQQHGKRIYYCHTVPRFAFDQHAAYRAKMPFALRWPFDLFTAWLRREFAAALRDMDVIVANSENVRSRLRKYLDLDAVVVNPPIDVDRFAWQSDGDYYISLARLMPLKRVDVIVQAFLRMPSRRLVVASGGPELGRLREIAGSAPNIAFTDWQSEEGIRRWLGNARAAVYVPVDEDFGMSPVEAMAAGKPVIGVAEGGLTETLIPGETGVLIDGELTVEKMLAAVEELESRNPASLRSACTRRAQAFSEQVFLTKMRALTG